MLSEERHRRIVAEVRRSGSATVVDLSDALEVSEATIRRDLDHLAEVGSIRRARGGAIDVRVAVRPEADSNSFADSAAVQGDSKNRVAAAAASLIRDGEVIALDIGTTVAAMCPALRDRSLTVVTSSLAVVRALADAPRIDIVILGGVLRPNYESMVGTLTESALRQLRVDAAFLGCAGIRSDGTVLDSTPSEIPIKRGLLDIATRPYLLAGQDKFPGTGFLEIAPITSFAALVTDDDLAPETLSLPDGEHLEVHRP